MEKKIHVETLPALIICCFLGLSHIKTKILPEVIRPVTLLLQVMF